MGIEWGYQSALEARGRAIEMHLWWYTHKASGIRYHTGGREAVKVRYRWSRIVYGVKAMAEGLGCVWKVRPGCVRGRAEWVKA